VEESSLDCRENFELFAIGERSVTKILKIRGLLLLQNLSLNRFLCYKYTSIYARFEIKKKYTLKITKKKSENEIQLFLAFLNHQFHRRSCGSISPHETRLFRYL
jgi:hypothetical protein